MIVTNDGCISAFRMILLFATVFIEVLQQRDLISSHRLCCCYFTKHDGLAFTLYVINGISVHIYVQVWHGSFVASYFDRYG